jgi:uncharacterized protein YdeI (YjbR/CyaY-like superfamily)
MAKSDPRVDAYIAKSAEFAKPILSYLRDVVHSAVPDVEETIKWGAPHFDYKGMILGIAAFKGHCAVHFWKGSLIGVDGYGDVKSISDLPPKKELTAFVKKLAQLNEQGVKVARPKRAPKKEAKMPANLAAALKKNRKAASTFEGFSPSHRREYIEWITDAKSDETRQRRIDQAVAWIAEGKPRNWKYMKK